MSKNDIHGAIIKIVLEDPILKDKISKAIKEAIPTKTEIKILIEKISILCKKFGYLGATARDIRDGCRPFRRLSIDSRNDVIEKSIESGLIFESKKSTIKRYINSEFLESNKWMNLKDE